MKVYINESGNRVNIDFSYVFQENRYANLRDPMVRAICRIVEIDEPAPPEGYSEATHNREELDVAPYVVYKRKSAEELALLKKIALNRSILNVEATITPRRLREAVLTSEGAKWLANKETEIESIRNPKPD